MSEEEEDKVVVHVRFAPNGDVVEVGERVKGKNPQEWFDFLAVCMAVSITSDCPADVVCSG